MMYAQLCTRFKEERGAKWGNQLTEWGSGGSHLLVEWSLFILKKNSIKDYQLSRRRYQHVSFLRVLGGPLIAGGLYNFLLPTRDRFSSLFQQRASMLSVTAMSAEIPYARVRTIRRYTSVCMQPLSNLPRLGSASERG